jgi:UDP-galactopyranose mutase
MEKKQTAVDILIKAILESDVELYILMQENGDFDQAKQMEKEQIEEAFVVHYTGTADKYYNETYGETQC